MQSMQTSTYLSEVVVAVAEIVLAMVLAYALVRLTVFVLDRPKKATQSPAWDNASEKLCNEQRRKQLAATPPRTIADEQGSILPTLRVLQARARRNAR